MFKKCSIAGVRVSSQSYHDAKAERGASEYFMSPSSIRAFMGCPSRWKAGYQPPLGGPKLYYLGDKPVSQAMYNEIAVHL